jgi:hypothetical protein
MTENADQKLARRCIGGLGLYAIERTLGFETNQKVSARLVPNPEKRNIQVRNMIKSVATFWELSENIETDFLKPFDESLKTAQHYFASETASFEQQKAIIRGLSRYAERLPEAATDARPELLRVRSLLEDIYVYLPWDASKLKINTVRDHIDRSLASLTALRNILFTRVLLGAERGPAMSGYVSGVVTDEAGVLNTSLYDELQVQYPDITEWPALCTIYLGGYGEGKHENATELDLQIMRETGDAFLDLEGVDYCKGTYEFKTHAAQLVPEQQKMI